MNTVAYIQGEEIEGPGEGYLVIKRAWPSGMRTLSGDHDRFQNVYFSNFKGYYMTGDGARRDADGYYWLIGEFLLPNDWSRCHVQPEP